MIELRIAGRPMGKDRPRFDRRTGRTYTTSQTVVAENEIRAAWREAGEPRLPDTAAIKLEMCTVVARPAGHFRKDGSLSAEGRRFLLPRNKKPDLDNALKLVMDALNTRAYRDDVQVVEVTVWREWGDTPETTIRLEEVA